MFRFVFSLAAITIAFPTTAIADSEIPSWCCPETCEVIDDSARIESSPTGNGVLRDQKLIPFSDNYYSGSAPDGRMRACIGFNAFGDPEVKCLLSPLPIT